MSRIESTRIAPIPVSDWDEGVLDALGAFPAGLNFVLQAHKSGEEFPRGANVLGALARHKELAKSFLVFNAYIATRSSLSPRTRELIVLRISWLCHSGYELAHHLILGRRVGLSEQELDRLQADLKFSEWSQEDACVLRAVDELQVQLRISDEIWADLKRHFGEHQLLDLMFLTGCYATLAMVLNSVGLPLEPGVMPVNLSVSS